MRVRHTFTTMLLLCLGRKDEIKKVAWLALCRSRRRLARGNLLSFHFSKKKLVVAVVVVVLMVTKGGRMHSQLTNAECRLSAFSLRQSLLLSLCNTHAHKERRRRQRHKDTYNSLGVSYRTQLFYLAPFVVCC